MNESRKRFRRVYDDLMLTLDDVETDVVNYNVDDDTLDAIMFAFIMALAAAKIGQQKMDQFRAEQGR